MISHGVEISIAGGGADEKDEAPKILIPQICKETIHKNVQVQRPKPFGRLPRKKESFAKVQNGWPEGED